MQHQISSMMQKEDDEYTNTKLTREDIKLMTEEIGEAMNQEYKEQDLSERRRKRSARGVAHVLTGAYDLQEKNQAIQAAEKMRETGNQTELYKSRPPDILSKEITNHGRMSQPLEEKDSITQDTVSVQH